MRGQKTKLAGAVLAILYLVTMGTEALAAQAAKSASPKPTTQEAPKPACGAIAGAGPLFAGRVLLLGEMHGTAESPAFVADLVCQALAAGRSVTVALEVPQQEEARVSAYLASAGSGEDRTALLAGPFWQDAYQDGRRSRAMLGLFEDLRRLGKSGPKDPTAKSPLRVTLLDSSVSPATSQERDRAMAERLKAAVEAHPQDLVISLTGNVHSRAARGVPWDKTFEPMGFLLAQSGPGLALTALDVGYTGGSAWTCLSPEASSCMERPLKTSKGDDQGRRVVLSDTPTPEGYRGVYNIGTLSASRPAARP